MKAVNIHWDIDYDETGSLPTEIDIPEDVANIQMDHYKAEEKIAEWLFNVYGYCHGGFRIEMTEEERQNYCKGCARSIYSDGPLGHSCDMNIADNGYYNHANYPCYTRVNNKEEKEDD